MRLALYEPDIPQNAGSLMRLGACLGVGLDIIEPCGFLLSDRNFRRAGMDYLKSADIRRHDSWARFHAGLQIPASGGGPNKQRLILLTTQGDMAYTDFAFHPDDTLLVGRESAGVPSEVHDAAHARLVIPLRPGLRSLNVAQAAAMVLGEALRQTGGFPKGIGLMHLTLFQPGGLIALGQVLMIDIVLAGDNAVVIGMAAARVPKAMRKKVILWGLAAAVVLRIGLAVIAVSLMKVIGLRLAGGILLLWVCWRFWRDIRSGHHDSHASVIQSGASLRRAILQIVLADVSMSLDNVLGVAGAAVGHLDVLVIGLLLSVALMGTAANYIAKLLERYRWISYVGLAIVVYVAITMIWHGGHQVLNAIN